jgi:hypothetical protein
MDERQAAPRDALPVHRHHDCPAEAGPGEEVAEGVQAPALGSAETGSSAGSVPCLGDGLSFSVRRDASDL